MTNQPIRTDDLSLAAYLNLNGFRHECLEMKDRRSAQWVFPYSDELMSSYRLYQEEGALVEPLQFTLKFSEIRKEMFSFVREQNPALYTR